MSNYHRAAAWIDRFASRLQRYNVDREEAVQIAAHVWGQDGERSSPERAADSIFADDPPPVTGAAETDRH